LVLATYPVSAAATRYRTVAYFEALRARGIEPELRTFYTDREFAVLYGGGLVRSAQSTLRGTQRLLQNALHARTYAGVFVQREAAPLGPALLESFLERRLNLPLIFDFDDAIWLSVHEKSAYPRLSRWMRQPDKALHLMRRATTVIAGSHALGAKARELNQSVVVLPTSVPAASWQPLPGKPLGALASDVPLVGWIGTHSTAPQLEVALRALERIAATGLKFRLKVFGAMRSLPQTTLAVDSEPWRLEREVEQFHELDIGLGPMLDDAWSAGKCGFKQIQYMATGIPMVSSPVGGAKEFLKDQQTALFASTVEEWEAQLTRLLRDAELRSRLATTALAQFSAELSIEAQAERFVETVGLALKLRAMGE
jgi:glycosyltransferase involved in cell wall biosynthesis